MRVGVEAAGRSQVTLPAAAMKWLSRREFVRLSTAGAVASPFLLDPAALGAAAPTAQEVVDRIRKNLALPWKPETVDTLKAGDPSTVVTGLVTTSLATIDVLRRAVKSGANMVITSGPTFYSRTDSPMPPAGRGRGAAASPPADPVFAAKNEFIRTNNLVVWRFSDHWRLRTPDPFAHQRPDFSYVGSARELGLEAKYETAPGRIDLSFGRRPWAR